MQASQELLDFYLLALTPWVRKDYSRQVLQEHFELCVLDFMRATASSESVSELESKVGSWALREAPTSGRCATSIFLDCHEA